MNMQNRFLVGLQAWLIRGEGFAKNQASYFHRKRLDQLILPQGISFSKLAISSTIKFTVVCVVDFGVNLLIF